VQLGQGEDAGLIAQTELECVQLRLPRQAERTLAA
jgi:hypothetical protein